MSTATQGPAVRVGIVSYNTGELLDRCLAALPAALDGLPTEVVVVDNASRDDSAARADRHRGVRVVRREENVGYARSMNLALADTEAPVLVALNPDCLPEPGSLATLVRTLQAHPDAGGVVPVLTDPYGAVQHSVHRFPSPALALVTGLVPHRLRMGRIGRDWWLEGYAPHDRLAPVPWAIGAVHCLRRSALGGEPPYSERWFMYAEDMAACWQLQERGWQVLLEPAARVAHVGNAAGAVTFADDQREARWLDATYDWYVQVHGPAAARRWALATLLGLGVKETVLARSPARAPERARVQALRRLHRERVRTPAGDGLSRRPLAIPDLADTGQF